MKSYSEILEYPKILQRLARHADFSGGARLALALTPTSDIREAQELLQLTAEARAFLVMRPEFALGGVTDIREWVDQARHGIILEPGDFLQVRDTLVASERIYRLLTSVEAQFPHLGDIAWRVVSQPGLTEAIGRVLNDRGEIRDDASPELARIHREIQTTQGRIQDKLQRMITSPSVAPYLQESLVTRREGRFVIPVKADFKGQVRGIVQDRSSSGVTIFVEPLPIVDLNNALRELHVAEQEEIRKLLLILTTQVAALADEIDATLSALSEIDFTFAKARYAEELQANPPKLLPIQKDPPGGGAKSLHPGTVLRLYSARHPLLDPDKVVPVDAVLDETTHILVITGPNTGGKTVTLKTVGLLVLMAQSGLHLPVESGSELSCFGAAYADIGDEQSIEQSLSTFSSHLANITSFLERVDHTSLVLLDELGAGTDPAEGAALARSLLDAFRERRCTVFVATHYPELKLYAHGTAGVCNASMEFDVETLAPTFHLNIGLPGRSNAFAIARRLGIPEPIIKAAEGLLSAEDLRADDMLEDLHALRLQAARDRDISRAAQKEVAAQATALRDRLANIEKERREILSQAQEDARAAVDSLREELSALRRRIRTVSIPEARDVFVDVAEALEEVEKQIPAFARLGEPLQELPEVTDAEMGEREVGGEPKMGDTVEVITLGLQGTLVDVEDGEALVQAGAIRTRVSFEDLRLLQRGIPYTPEITIPRRSQAASPRMETDLRGMTVEEALGALDRYLDDASLAGLPWVRVIHGKGTGTLRREIRSFLGDHPLVVAYESAEEREGGDGVTLVRLMQV